MDDFIGAVLSISIGFTVGFIGGHYDAVNALEQDAFERGYMVQCVGMTGYHWECDE